MLFLHQPIQSFLSLGVCKEYTHMAKPRVPKKQNGEASAATTLAASAPIADLETSASATAVAEPKKPARKPAIVKTDGRTNLVPINVDEEIRRLADRKS